MKLSRAAALDIPWPTADSHQRRVGWGAAFAAAHGATAFVSHMSRPDALAPRLRTARPSNRVGIGAPPRAAVAISRKPGRSRHVVFNDGRSGYGCTRAPSSAMTTRSASACGVDAGVLCGSSSPTSPNSVASISAALATSGRRRPSSLPMSSSLTSSRRMTSTPRASRRSNVTRCAVTRSWAMKSSTSCSRMIWSSS